MLEPCHLRVMLAVPTPVGVNLKTRHLTTKSKSRPHARGGEPKLTGDWKRVVMAVPTPVGVNRR